MLAIHKSEHGFHPEWRAYCTARNIAWKTVDCYASNIVAQLEGCSALLWHHSQGNPKDILIAKQILFALEHTGFSVFPDFNTAWHFDDKVAQKYLLERVNAPLVPAYVFVDREAALEWATTTSFPKVWKLRGGAGASHVRLIPDIRTAKRYINRAFGRGFTTYHALSNLQERWRMYRQGQSSIFSLLKGLLRIIYPPRYAKVQGRQRGYIYFQDFVPGNSFDIRIIVIGGKAFGLKRFVRDNDFRASGSGNFHYEKEQFDERCVALAFELSKRLNMQCTAYDFIFDANQQPLVVEISYGYKPEGYADCPGYWDTELQWYKGQFNPQAWMVDLLLNNFKSV